MSSALAAGLAVGGVFQLIGAVACGLLLAAAAKAFGLQFANFPLKLLVVLLQRREASQGIGVSALPIAGLLPQFQIFASQGGEFGAQLIDFGQEALTRAVRSAPAGLRSRGVSNARPMTAALYAEAASKGRIG